jgi:diguanylate cyclase (GGDEF)-like protein/PAS domain S-box-containing protein
MIERFLWEKDPMADHQALQRRIAELESTVQELKRSREALSASEERFRSVLENIRDGYYEVDLTGKFTYCNQVFSEFLGLSPAELVGTTYKSYADPQTLHHVFQAFSTVFQSGTPGVVVDVPVIRKDGNRRTVEFSVSLVADQAGRPAGFRGIARDITQRSKAEEDLKKAISLLEATLEATDDGILVVDLAGKIVRFNRQFAQIWRIPEAILETQDDNQALNYVLDQLKEPETFINKVRELYAHPEAESFNLLEFKDGRYIERLSKPQRLEDRIVGRVWSFRDITVRHRAEQALRESEEKYRTLVENANEAIFVAQDGHLKFFNPRTVSIVGYTPEEIAGLPFIHFIHPEDRSLVVERHQKRLQGEEPPRIYPFRIVTNRGQVRWVQINSVVILWEGRPATLNFLVDVSDRIAIEAALKESESRYRTIFENTGTAMAIIEEDTVIFLVNSEFEKLTGYSRQEIEGRRSWTEFVLYDDLERMKTYHRLRRVDPQAVPGHYEFRLVTKQNQIRHITLTVTVLPDGKRSVASLQDISELKAVEEKLRELSLLDELTGLYNRRGFFTLAEQELKVAHRLGKGVILLFADLDDLKGINDAYGHQQGDQALIATARVLKSTFRDLDIISRIGGDEFVILALNGGSRESQDILIGRLLQGLQDYNQQARHPFALSLSIGLAFHGPGATTTVDRLLSEADQRMYGQKKRKTV